MEIQTKLGASGLTDRLAAKRPIATTTESNSVSFGRTVALESGLKSLPDIRPEAVERARALIADVNYPATETIRKISILLAMEL